MNSILKTLSICICLILPMSVSAESCDSEHCNLCSNQTTCEQSSNSGVCMWNGSACVERCPLNQAQDGCQSYDGCGYMAGSCSPCDANHYNNDTRYNTVPNGAGGLCADVGPGSYRNNEGTGQKPCPSTANVASMANQHVTTPLTAPDIYIGTCQCGNDQYIIHTTYNNSHDYYCGICGDGIHHPDLTGHNNVKECQGALSSNPTHGYHTDYQGIKIEFQCPKNSTWQPGSGASDAGRCGYVDGNGYNPCDQGYVSTIMHFPSHEQFFACCIPNATYNWEASNYEYDWNQDRCECRIPGARIERNNSGELTFCGCNNGNNVVTVNGSCQCSDSTHMYANTYNQPATPQIYNGESTRYLSSCTSCNSNSSGYSDSTDQYPKWCECDPGYWQEDSSSPTNKTPSCTKCPAMTTTTETGSVGASSCRLTSNYLFYTSENMNSDSAMRLIPSGSNIQILPALSSGGTPTTGANTNHTLPD